VVLNIGARFDPAILGPAPANVELHRFVPQLRVLAHARAFVSHGGMNGIMEALNAGVPQVAIPFTPEQQANAVRLVQLGIGARRSLDGLTPQTLRQAVERLGTDETMSTRIAAARRELATTGGPARAADVIEACLPAARVAATG
jgi:MGT family glycosyltransferase